MSTMTDRPRYWQGHPLYLVPHDYRHLRGELLEARTAVLYVTGPRSPMVVWMTSLPPEHPITDEHAADNGHHTLSDLAPEYTPTDAEVVRALRGPAGPVGPAGQEGEQGEPGQCQCQCQQDTEQAVSAAQHPDNGWGDHDVPVREVTDHDRLTAAQALGLPVDTINRWLAEDPRQGGGHHD